LISDQIKQHVHRAGKNDFVAENEALLRPAPGKQPLPDLVQPLDDAGSDPGASIGT
jgi:hypothetical protein